ncbi:TfoX/Sxy family DNA transformation protein [Asticcacaulis solisilvae]|uniref:TfoX/Sxy family DNA transformation protein n=1 Tax=Asticcacaulis solisilvae TaxID=1217274 RepID=UPI003FD75688
MPGLGPQSRKWLKDIGITTRKDLEKTGAVDAYARLKHLYPDRVSLNLLWGLYAALNGMEAKAVTPDIKHHLQTLLAGHTTGTTR